MPDNVVALVMKADPGAELACRARSYRFARAGGHDERGVISYYTTRALTEAATIASWLQLTDGLAAADFRQGRLPAFYRPSLQIIGPGAPKLAGDPVRGGTEPLK